MLNARRICSAWGLMMALLCSPVMALPAQGVQGAPQGTPPTGAGDPHTALRELPKAAGLTDAERGQVEQLLRHAIEADKQATQLEQQGQTYQQQAANAVETVKRIEADLLGDQGQTYARWLAALPQQATPEQWSAWLSDSEQVLDKATDDDADLLHRLTQQIGRPSQIGGELAADDEALHQMDQAATPAHATEASRKAMAMFNAAERQRLISAISLLKQEQETYLPRLQLLTAQMRAGEHTVQIAQRQVKTLRARLLQSYYHTYEHKVAERQQELDALPADQPALRKVAQRNLDITRETVTDIRRINELRTLREHYRKEAESTVQTLQYMRERLSIGGDEEAIGLALQQARRKLTPTVGLRRELESLRSQQADTNLAQIDLSEEADRLRDLEDLIERTLATMKIVDGAQRKAVRATLYNLYNVRYEAGVTLAAVRTTLIEGLGGDTNEPGKRKQNDIQSYLSQLIEATEGIDTLLDSEMFHIPTHPAVDKAWGRLIVEGVGNLVEKQDWPATLASLRVALRAAPLSAVGILILLAGSLLLNLRLPHYLARYAGPLKRVREDRYRFTLQALALSLLACLGAPLLFCVLMWLARAAGGGGNTLGEALAPGFEQSLWCVFVLAGTGMAVRENGLASVHLRWPETRRLALRRVLPWLYALPWLYVLTNAASYLSDDALSGGAGRALVVLNALIWAALSAYLLAPGTLWTLRNTLVQEPVRLRQLLRVSLTAGGVLIAVIALEGYVIAAMLLCWGMFKVICALLIVALLHGLGVRWLLLNQRRLAFKRALEKAESEASAADDEQVEPLEPEEITLADVGEQNQRLLQAATAVTVVATILWMSRDVAPALAFLGNITLWHSVDTVNGKNVATSVSLLSVLLSVVVFCLTWVGVRNLPGLLEVGVLRRFEIDAPTRYATTSVARYAIIILGVLTGAALLGVQWGQLQWMAAAFTVGLGFGLQEIFGNFVSGLIVLFERPIRVGDIINIGGVEGTVMRIRTRATTILNSDNKEVVVPNKAFITEQLINWTLSDTVTRMVLRISVAYASEAEQVRQLLLKIANEHLAVLKKPAASCWLSQLGASSLDFDLCIYLGQTADRVPASDAILNRVLIEFRRHGIDIPFPQTDVWFRNALMQPK